MRRARTWGWTRTRLYHEPSNDLGPSSPRQSCPVCIIDTPGYDFREGQPSLAGHARQDNTSAGVWALGMDQVPLLERGEVHIGIRHDQGVNPWFESFALPSDDVLAVGARSLSLGRT